MVCPEQALPEPLHIWAEAYVMQAGNGRRRAISTQLQLLETVATPAAYWAALEVHGPSTASLSSLHVFRAGIVPQYDDPKNANGGHFKMKPHNVEDAYIALRRISTAFIEGTLPFHPAINGLTIAKKAKSSLVKVWVTDSLNQTVISALTEWFDANIADLCGRRLFSPHKYILNTYSQQRRLGVPSSRPHLQALQQPWPAGVLPDSQPDAAEDAPRPKGRWVPTGNALLARTPSLPGAALCPSSTVGPDMHDPWRGGPVPPPAIPAVLSLPQSLSASSSTSSVSSLAEALAAASQSAWFQPPIPMSPAEYESSLGHLMHCSRSDPAWGNFTAAAVCPRLEATVRKCGALRYTGGAGQPLETVSPVASVRSSFSDTPFGDIFG